jgi:HD superfamily phosphohydrolase
MYMYVYMHNVYVVTWYMQNIMQKYIFHLQKQYTGTCNDIVKPAHVITSIKKLPALKDHFFLVLS